MPEALRPLEGRARWAVIALVAVIVTDILAIGSDLLEIRLMNRLVGGEDVSPSSLDSNDIRQIVVGLLVLAAYVASIVLFIRWFHRAYSNLPALGSEPRFKRGWAIGGWFVPIMWFWRPKQIANDIWRGADPSPGHSTSRRQTSRRSSASGGRRGSSRASCSRGRVWPTRALRPPWRRVCRRCSVTLQMPRTSAGRQYSTSSQTASTSRLLAILVVQRMTSRQSERERMLAALRESPPAVGSTPEVE